MVFLTNLLNCKNSSSNSLKSPHFFKPKVCGYFAYIKTTQIDMFKNKSFCLTNYYLLTLIEEEYNLTK